MRISLTLGLFAVGLFGSAIAPATAQTGPAKSIVATPAVRVAIESPDVAAWTGRTAVPELSGAVMGQTISVKSGRGLGRLATRILSHTSTIAQGLTRSALRFIGVPYVFGGTSGYGFDCSGYVQHVFAMMGLRVPRTADAQYYAGSRIRGGMSPGDLVFFQTYEPGPSHVGIYLGHGHFAHASSSHGVMVSSLTDSYWSARYIGAKRFVAR